MKDNIKILGGLLETGEHVASYVLEGEYFCRHLIAYEESDDIASALEMTLNRLIDYHFTDEEIYNITGMEKSDENEIMIDLGFSIKNILNYIPSLLSYKDALKDRHCYIMKNFNNDKKMAVYAYNEGLASKMAFAITHEEGWYPNLFEPEDEYVYL